MAWVLLEMGANINARNKAGMTPLHLTICKNHVRFVRFLVDMGAEPSVVDGNNKTALHWAITELVEGSTKYIEVTERMVERAKNTAAQDNEGLSALHMMASQGSHSSHARVHYVRMKLESGCDLDVEDFCERQTPL
ncbi:ankyrin repeat-containing domain protein [Dactylonectria macrodidyma]|uniref:Ankyrin repeat-containing domain protein n=1 Tax=Dactylonectria macrodidyma TaxID=307937 RepID=A0A9P9ER41_9HYPO|nr:ankyrin repeat-containing domain protein [Dactylonectria macrodidyma]